MLFNMWYVGADAAEISDQPKQIKILGQNLVLFRDKTGTITCLSDICIHRGAALSAGKVIDGCIQCPYHGWRFNHCGIVTKIPAQKADVKIPRRARVDAYPVIIKFGWVWIFMGDLPESERPPLPEFPEYEDAAWRIIRGEFTWQADYARVIENGLDFSHAPFVHPSFGDPDRAEIDDFEVTHHPWGASASVSYIPPLYKGIWKLLRRDRTPVLAQPGFHMSGGLMSLKIHITKQWTQVIFDVNTPVDENTTHTRWIHARNFMRSRLADRDARRRVHNVFLQDAAVIEKIQPQLLPVDLSEELSLKSDGLQIAYRRMRRNFIKKGWGIDVDHFKDKENIKRAKVIASPARKQVENADIQWVLPQVPAQKIGVPSKLPDPGLEDLSFH